jgi:hypothetical protein
MTGQVLDQLGGMGVDLHDTELKLSGTKKGERDLHASAREFQTVRDQLENKPKPRDRGKTPRQVMDEQRAGRKTEIAALARAKLGGSFDQTERESQDRYMDERRERYSKQRAALDLQDPTRLERRQARRAARENATAETPVAGTGAPQSDRDASRADIAETWVD